MTVINIDAMLEKRREVLGEGDRFQIVVNEKEFWLKAPELADQEWNDEFSAFREDAEAGRLTNADAREWLVSLFVDDKEVEALKEACAALKIDIAAVIQYAISEHAEEVAENPTPKSSRRFRRQSKRR